MTAPRVPIDFNKTRARARARADWRIMRAWELLSLGDRGFCVMPFFVL